MEFFRKGCNRLGDRRSNLKMTGGLGQTGDPPVQDVCCRSAGLNPGGLFQIYGIDFDSHSRTGRCILILKPPAICVSTPGIKGSH